MHSHSSHRDQVALRGVALALAQRQEKHRQLEPNHAGHNVKRAYLRRLTRGRVLYDAFTIVVDVKRAVYDVARANAAKGPALHRRAKDNTILTLNPDNFTVLSPRRALTNVLRTLRAT